MKKTYIGDQGEVSIFKIDTLPEGMVTKEVERCASGFIISHSEKGHHHVLTGGDVMEHVCEKIPAGIKHFYAILKEPFAFKQDAGNPHDPYLLEAGVYHFRTAREYDPFLKEARRVAD